VHGESRINTGEASNEVALPSVDGFFGGVGTMHVGWGQLERGMGFADIGFECLWALIV
jgi:hypothetical protein